MKPRITIRKTLAIREREERWKLARVAEAVTARTLDSTLKWTRNCQSGPDFWTCTQGNYGLRVAIGLMVEQPPEEPPHQIKLTFYDLDSNCRRWGDHCWWNTPVLFEITDPQALAGLGEALQARASEVDKLIQSMIEELENLPAARLGGVPISVDL